MLKNPVVTGLRLFTFINCQTHSFCWLEQEVASNHNAFWVSSVPELYIDVDLIFQALRW